MPLKIDIFDAALNPIGWARRIPSMDCEPILHDAGQSRFSLFAAHPVYGTDDATDAAMRDGACYRITVNDVEVDSGRILTREYKKGEGTISFRGLSWWGWLFPRILGWNVTDHGTDLINYSGIREYWTATGTVEDVVKAACRANWIQRLGMPIDIPATQSRGAGNQSIKLRFEPLEDKVATVLRSDNTLSWRITQPGGGKRLLFDCAPVTYLTPAVDLTSTVFEDWEINLDAETASRVVIGGMGDGLTRQFWWKRTTDAASLAADGTFPTETFTTHEQTDAPTTWPTAGETHLKENGAKVGLSATLAATTDISWPLGSGVKILLPGGALHSDRVTALTVTAKEGHTELVRARIGGLDKTPGTVLQKPLTDLMRLRRLKTNR